MTWGQFETDTLKHLAPAHHLLLHLECVSVASHARHMRRMAEAHLSEENDSASGFHRKVL